MQSHCGVGHVVRKTSGGTLPQLPHGRALEQQKRAWRSIVAPSGIFVVGRKYCRNAQLQKHSWRITAKGRNHQLLSRTRAVAKLPKTSSVKKRRIQNCGKFRRAYFAFVCYLRGEKETPRDERFAPYFARHVLTAKGSRAKNARKVRRRVEAIVRKNLRKTPLLRRRMVIPLTFFRKYITIHKTTTAFENRTATIF